MERSQAFRRFLVCAVLVAAGPGAAEAQTAAKPPPRLPPSPSESARIPAGVNTGSPGTSDNLPLGTPVSPTLGADRKELTTRSAAARAATRPKPAASGADCTRLVADVSASGVKPVPGTLANPVRGGSAMTGPATAPARAASATRLDC